MKKNTNLKKLMVVLMCVITVLFCNNSIIQAATVTNNAKVVANSQVALYNDENEVVAYYFRLSNGGYVITTADGTDFIEYSLKPVNFQLNNRETYYYPNPCSFYKKVNNQLAANCITQEKVTLNAMDFAIEAEHNANVKAANALANQVVKAAASPKTEDKLKHSTYTYNYNPDGRCGAVAGAIVLRYYNDYVTAGYVPTKYRTADGKALINYLTDTYLGTGTNYAQLTKGLNKYLKENCGSIRNSFSKTTGKNSTSVYNKIVNYITDKDKPVIVGLTAHPKYSEHWVVGTGYSTTKNSSNTVRVVIVNDGWGNTNVSINLSYVDGCIYMG